MTDAERRILMLAAAREAERFRFRAAPNPTVGAVLVRDGRIVAKGAHSEYGGPHAEIVCLADAAKNRIDPAGCLMAVTLEPCAHHGKTPPCAVALADAGIREVLVGTPDPNPEAAGGAAYLAERGVIVHRDIARDVTDSLVNDFLVWQTTELPYTLLKLASTLDGRIATRAGHSRWISGEETRQQVHELRRYMGAVMVGGNTFYQDNPRLTCRAPDGNGPKKQPLAVIVTSRLPQASGQFHLLEERPESVIFWTTVAAAASPKAEALRKLGCRVRGLSPLPRGTGRMLGLRAELDLAQGLRELRTEGCHHVLCEGGGRLGLSLLHSCLAQEMHLHVAPVILGDNEATPLFDGLSPLQLDEALRLRFTGSRASGQDMILTLQSRPVSAGGEN